MSSLMEILTIDQIDEDHFITRVMQPEFPGLYGGQVAAQSLLAACRTIAPEQLPHSLHAYFLRSGRSALPIELEVFRDRDGRSFSARRVVASQAGEVIFNMSASFQFPEDGPSVQAMTMPKLEPAHGPGVRREPQMTPDIELVNAAPVPGRPMPDKTWTRATVELPDDPQIHACVLTFVSDFFTGLVQFDEYPEHARTASLDHAMWFYRPTDMRTWHLMDWHAQSMAHGRGHYIGHIYDASGRLVAGIGQEMVVRASRSRLAHGQPVG